jgi:hypothetical protein
MLSASSEHIATVISQATAPAFVLGAVAGFISILASRLNRVLDRIKDIDEISDDAERRASIRDDIPGLKKRVRLLNQSILIAVFSAVVSAVIVLIAFLSALVGIRHEYGVALLFVVALGLLVGSLVRFAMEVQLALKQDGYV